MIITSLYVEYPIGVVALIGEVQLSRNHILKSGCEIEVSTLLLVVEILTDLRRVVSAIDVLMGHFDVDNM